MRCWGAQVLDSGLSMLHVPYSYGFAIILLTIIVKALTFPLSRKQARCASSRSAVRCDVWCLHCSCSCSAS